MVTKVKNLTSKTLEHDKFKVTPATPTDLKWTKSNMTPAAFGYMLAMYEEGKIEFWNDKDKKVKDESTSKYYILTSAGKKSSKAKSVKVDHVIEYLNERYNDMINS